MKTHKGITLTHTNNIAFFPSKLNRAAQELEKAKAYETEARKRRIAAENAVLAIMGAKPEGATTQTTKEYTLVTIGEIRRQLIDNELADLERLLPEAIFNRVITFKPALNLDEVKYIDNNEPELYQLLARVIHITEIKPTVSIKPLKRGS